MIFPQTCEVDTFREQTCNNLDLAFWIAKRIAALAWHNAQFRSPITRKDGARPGEPIFLSSDGGAAEEIQQCTHD